MSRESKTPALLKSLTVALMIVAVLGVPAFAQEDVAEERPGLLDRFDQAVGQHVVGPLDKVLFLPVYKKYVAHESGAYVLMEDGEYATIEAGRYDQLEDGTYEASDTGSFVKTSTGDYLTAAAAQELTNYKRSELPLIVLVLAFGGLFFTFRYGFVNIRLFKHSIDVIRGKYDKPEDTGEVSHFKALTSALSATVGLGNISGVAIAISMGGAGAVFWMWMTAFFGMSMKFSSCTFAHLYRRVHPDGRVLGGPMVYLEQAIADRLGGMKPVGKIFAVVFAVLTVFAAFGGGNMFQGNQTASILAMQFFDGSESDALRIGLGVFLAALVGVVLIGGIRRIGEVTSRLVPTMCVFYCSVCLVIVLMNYEKIPALFTSIFAEAFVPQAMYGGFLGVLVQGMRRAAFSNEAGLGSAAIAHAAAKTEEPVREGVVAMMGPFIDTIVVCTMTALTILITGAHLEPGEGVQITARAFSDLGSFVPYVLCLAVFVFAYSTMISWGYYGERATEYLFGERGIVPFRVVYVLVVVLGPTLSLGNVVGFSDMMLLSMAFPNIIGMIIISRKVKEMSADYVRRLRSGEMKPVR